MLGASATDSIVTSFTPEQRATGFPRRPPRRPFRVRPPAEILPWALLSIAALVLSASAADALQKGAALPDLQASTPCDGGRTACAAAKAPRRYVLSADAFALDSAELPSELKRPLDAVAEALRQEGAHAVRIEVHTDASGPQEARRTLTQRRAEAIKAYLIGRGVDATALHAVGMGSSVPKPGQDPFAAANRRIEVVRL